MQPSEQWSFSEDVRYEIIYTTNYLYLMLNFNWSESVD